MKNRKMCKQKKKILNLTLSPLKIKLQKEAIEKVI